VYEIGWVPFHEPDVALSVWPTTAWPETVGAVTSAGAPGFTGTWAVAFARTVFLPSAFDAVTSSRSVCRSSAGTTVYVVPVAFVILLQASPLSLQRSHWYW